jgi:hypothetical protein
MPSKPLTLAPGQTDAELPKEFKRAGRPPSPAGASFLVLQDEKRRRIFTRYLNKYCSKTVAQLEKTLSRRKPKLSILEACALHMLIRCGRKGPDVVTQNLLFFLGYAPGTRAKSHEKEMQKRAEMLAENGGAFEPATPLPSTDEFEDQEEEEQDDDA